MTTGPNSPCDAGSHNLIRITKPKNEITPDFATSGPPLLYSDNPESVGAENVISTPEGVLWTHTINTQQVNNWKTHRIFLWHINDGKGYMPTGADTLAVTFENLSPTNSYHLDWEYESCYVPDGTLQLQSLDLGKQLAHALVSNVYHSKGSVTVPPIDPNHHDVNNAALFTLSWKQAELRGAQIQIRKILPNSAYVLRVVYGLSTTNWSSIKSCPPEITKVKSNPPVTIPDGQTDPRGSWGFSVVYQPIEYICSGSGNHDVVFHLNEPRPGAFDENLSSGAEVCCWNNTQLKGSQCSISNRAPFGAIIQILLTIKNDCTHNLKMQPLIMPFTKPWPQKGAKEILCCVTRFNGGPVLDSGNMHVENSSPPYVCHPLTDSLQDIPKQSTKTFWMDIAVAGGSSTPLGLALRFFDA